MKIERFDKLRIIGTEAKKEFEPFAKYCITDEVPNTDDDNRAVIEMFTAIDMATGAAAVKDKYLIIGGLIGASIILAIGTIILGLKKKMGKG